MEILDKRTGTKHKFKINTIVNYGSNETIYIFEIDKNTNKKLLEKNIYRICETLKENLKLSKYEIINYYIIRGYAI